MSATLSSAREQFMQHMYRDNVASERPRLLSVLDAVIAWSASHPDAVRFRPDENASGTISFEVVATNTVFWVATPRRGNVPLLQLLPGASKLLNEKERHDAVARLNARTREQNPAGRMQIGFGALKNADGRTAVLALMSELLDKVSDSRPSSRVTTA